MTPSSTIALAGLAGLIAASCVEPPPRGRPAAMTTDEPPLVADPPDLQLAKGATTTVTFVAGDDVTSFADLTVSAAVTTGPTNLTITQPTISTNGRRSFTVTGNRLSVGNIVTLTAIDGLGQITSTSFTVGVYRSGNTPPTLTATPGHAITYLGGAPLGWPVTVGDAESGAAAVTLSATSSEPALVPDAGVVITGADATRVVTITPAPGASGIAVLRLTATDGDLATTTDEVIVAVIDPGAPGGELRRPTGLFVLDGQDRDGLRDDNLSSAAFVDGYVLRVDWSTLEPEDDQFDPTIVTNVLARLPVGQRLSLGIGGVPTWLTPALSWSAEGATGPVPWDPVTQAEFAELATWLATVPTSAGVALRDDPRLAAINGGLPGLKGGVRALDELAIDALPDYSRSRLEGAVVTHLATLTDRFPATPVHLGLWTYDDLGDDDGDPTDQDAEPWRDLVALIADEFDGISRPHVGLWMENAAASRPSADALPIVGLPDPGYAAPLDVGQATSYVGFQALGSWSQPFNPDHVDNNLNGSPEDGLAYGLTQFGSQYLELYRADVDFAPYADELTRWRAFLAAYADAVDEDPPVGTPLSTSGPEDTTLVGALPVVDPDGDPLTFTLVTAPSHGAVTLTGSTWTYQPVVDFAGVDGFTFTATDGTFTSAPTTVTLTVTAVNDPPIGIPPSTITSSVGRPVAITLAASDVDGPGLSFAVTRAPTRGTLSGTAPHLTFTPTATGNDVLVFTVSDGTLTSAPVSVAIQVR